MFGVMYPQKMGLTSVRTAAYDVITEAHVCGDIQKEFGNRYLRGTCVLVEKRWKEGNQNVTKIDCKEKLFRSFLKDIDITNAVEIGTYLGVSSLLLAHYAYHLTTIDVYPRTEPIPLWDYFGVSPKIEYAVVMNDDIKKKYVESLGFDFAYIDGDHRYEGVKSDFELVKRCGRVLIGCYGQYEGVTKLVDEISAKTNEHFAYWEK